MSEPTERDTELINAVLAWRKGRRRILSSTFEPDLKDALLYEQLAELMDKIDEYEEERD